MDCFTGPTFCLLTREVLVGILGPQLPVGVGYVSPFLKLLWRVGEGYRQAVFYKLFKYTGLMDSKAWDWSFVCDQSHLRVDCGRVCLSQCQLRAVSVDPPEGQWLVSWIR